MLGDHIDDLCADPLLRFTCRRADMRRAGYHRMGIQRMILTGLLGEYVKSRRTDFSGFECFEKRIFIQRSKEPKSF